jgi:hypothetical protein
LFPRSSTVVKHLLGGAFPLQDVTLKDDLSIKNKGRKIPHHEQVKEGDAEEMGKDVFLKLNLHAGVQRIEPQIKEFGGKAMPGVPSFL